MAYVPTNPTGDPPRHLLTLDETQLVAVLKAHIDNLTTNNRIHVTRELHDANHQSKFIIEILLRRVEERHEEAMATLKGLIEFTEKERDEARKLFKQLQVYARQLANDQDALRHRRDALEREVRNLQGHVGGLRQQIRSNQDERNDQANRFRLIRNNLQGRVNRLIGERDVSLNQLAIERLTSRNLGRIRTRMQVQMAVLRIQAQWFRIRQAGPMINNPIPPNNSQVVWLQLQ